MTHLKSSWTENLKLSPVENLDSNESSKSLTFSITSFNILAEAYLTPRSHKNLPPAFEDVVFNKECRRKLLCTTLTKLTEMFDILCLQELDNALRDLVVKVMSKLGFGYIIAPRGDETAICSPEVSVDIGSSYSKNDEADVRSDGCATFFKSSKWKCVDYKVVNFDELADEDRPRFEDVMKSPSSLSTDRKNNRTSPANADSSMDDNNDKNETASSNDKPKKKKRKHNALSGIIASYRRRNAALLVEFQQKEQFSIKTRNIIVANAHLYWHPGYEYVKLSQAHFLLLKVKQFAARSNQELVLKYETPAIIICGDMNSKPNSAVHRYLTEGVVDARTVAPWNFHFDEAEEQEQLSLQMKSMSLNLDEVKNGNENEDIDQDPITYSDEELASKMESLNEIDGDVKISNNKLTSSGSNHNEFPAYDEGEEKNSDVKDTYTQRYLMDITLNKFTRWLRILGLDASLETAEEERLRTGEGKTILFERCRKEERNLITTSKTIMFRKDCPPGTYLVNPSTLKKLEDTLVKLLLLHGITLYPKKFLTRCVVCNGKIVEVFDREDQKEIFDTYASPDLGEELDHVYKCKECGQGYWWSSSPTSSASRVKDACTRLLKLCLRGGVHIEGQPEFFKHVDYDAERRLGEKERSSNGETNLNGIEEVLGWLKNCRLRSPFCLRSSYASDAEEEVNGELLPFTNVTSDFVGALDYILFEKDALQQVGRLEIPTNFKTLNTNGLQNGHLLPSDEWPSDHLCIGAKFALKIYNVENISNRLPLTVPKTSIPSAYVPEGVTLKPITASKTSIPSAYVPEGVTLKPITASKTSIPSAYVPEGVTLEPITASKTSIPSAYVPEGVTLELITASKTSIPSAYVPEGVTLEPITASKTSIPSAYVPEGVTLEPSSRTSILNAYAAEGVTEDMVKHVTPQLGCECGCVPKVLSLFQMAELRKQVRLKKMGK